MPWVNPTHDVIYTVYDRGEGKSKAGTLNADDDSFE